MSENKNRIKKKREKKSFKFYLLIEFTRQ